MIEQAVETFVQEAQDLLSDPEAEFLAMEDAPTPERVDAVFRALHTIKGSGSMFGYTALSRFAHNFENAYEMVRDGTLAPNKKLVDLSLSAHDMMAEFLELGGDGEEAEALLGSARCRSMLEQLVGLTGAALAPAAEPKEGDITASDAEDAGSSRAWDIRFKPDPASLRNGMQRGVPPSGGPV